MKHKVFIDGQAGTTGLRLAERLSGRPDIELIEVDEARRKDEGARLACIAAADVTFLCLPDDGAREIIAAIDAAASAETAPAAPSAKPPAAIAEAQAPATPATETATAKPGPGRPLAEARIIDCSTAHRTASGWTYGMPELFRGDGYARAEKSLRVSNPGCYPTGFILSIRPLVDAGLVDPGAALSAYALTGYSGGGKAMISKYEGEEKQGLRAPGRYALEQRHKHLPEMQKYAGLENAPLFSPIICDYYSGMLVGVPLPRDALRRNVSAEDIEAALAEYYKDSPIVKVRAAGGKDSEAADRPGAEAADRQGAKTADGGVLSADAFANRDDLEIIVTGEAGRIEIISRFDNLGKGASGAAVQNMNLILGLPEWTGLVIGN